jgi:ribosomal-protein-alanine N-acetyltransferase
MARSPRRHSDGERGHEPSLPRDGGMIRVRAAIVGREVLLRHPVDSDREEWLSLRRRNRGFLERWEPQPLAGTLWGEDATFDRFLHSAVGDDRRRYVACESATGAIFGQFSLSNIIRGPLQQCFVGYWIGEEFSGRGLAAEALRLSVRIAFEDLGLHRVEANIQPHNETSRRLASRVGFRLEGFSPKYLEIAGRWADHERWAMTIEDFQMLARGAALAKGVPG